MFFKGAEYNLCDDKCTTFTSRSTPTNTSKGRPKIARCTLLPPVAFLVAARWAWCTTLASAGTNSRRARRTRCTFVRGRNNLVGEM